MKIDSDVDLSGSNNPHQGCGIAVEFYGWAPAGETINAYVVISGQGGAGAGTIAATSPPSGAANPFSFVAGTGTSAIPDFAKFYEIITTGLTPKPGSTTAFQVDIDVFDAATNQPLSKQKIITVETCNADLAVDKRGPANYLQLGTGSYTIDVTNTGPNRSGSPITVVDTLPAGETATSAGGGAWVCVISSGGSIVTCTLNSELLRLETAPRITVGVTYSATAVTDLTDTATVDGPRLDLVSGNNSDSVTTRPTPVLDVGIVKTATPASIAPGANITYDLVVTNTGTAPVTSFTVSDTLGTGLTFVSAASLSAGLTCNAGAPASCSFSGVLAPNANVTARVVATVGAGFTGQSVTNAASVSMVGDTASSNNNDSVTTPVVHPRDLGVVKTVTAPAGGAAINPGDSITYSLVVTNHGNGPVSSFTLTDTVPSTHNLTSVTPNDGRLTCSTAISCTFAAAGSPLNPGESVSVTAVMTVNSNVTATTVSNTATVPADSNNANNSSTATTNVNQPSDVKLVKTANPGTPGTPGSVKPGDTISFLLTASNDGVLPITGFTVSDDLDSSLTWVSTSTTGTGFSCLPGDPVQCTFSGTLAANASVTATIVATVNANFLGTAVPNVATATLTSATDADNSNDSSSTSTPVTQPKDLELKKTATPPTAMPGDSITYTLTAKNVGVLPITDFTIGDPLGTGLVWQSTATAGGTALTCTSTAPVSCTFAAGNLTTGQSVVVTVVAKVDPAFTGSSVTNAALATMAGDTDTTNNSAAVSTGVTHPLDLAVVKTDSPDPVAPGDDITYAITVTNAGNGPVTSFTLTDTVPSTHTLKSVTPGAGLTCDTAVVCTFAGTLAPGASVAVQVVMTVKPTVTATSVSNTASVPADSNTRNDSSTATTTVVHPVDLSILKSASPASVKPGENITYTLTVTNQGNGPVPSFAITDTVPSSQTFVSATPNDSRLTCTSAIVCTFAGAPLAAGASVSVTVVLTVKSTVTATQVSNTATIPADSDNTDNSSTATTDVVQPLDLAVVKTDSPDPVAPGDDITYAITVTNAGNGPVTGFTLTDTVPSTHTLKSVTPGAGLTCDTAVVCTFAGTLASGASVAVQIVMTVKSSVTATSVSNTASVPPDSNTSNDSSTARTAVTQPADVKLVKTATPNPVRPGDTITYTLTASNDGILPITAFTITDTLNSDLTWVSTSTPAGNGVTCNTGGSVSCSFAGSLTTGQSVVVTITATVKASFTGTSTGNTGTATMAGDSDNSNDSSSVSTDVTQPKDLALTKTATPSPVSAGGNVTYTLTARNAAVLPITAFTLSDPLGAGLTWISTSTTTPGLTCNTGAPVSCSFAGNLTSGQTAVVTVVANVPASFAGSSVSNAATSSTPGDGNGGNDTATVTTPVVRPDLAITKTAPASAVSGTTGNYVLTVSNQGNGPAAGPVTVTDAVPAGATATGATGTGWTCTTSPAPVSCSLAAGLAAGATAAPITVNVTWGAPGTVTNTATVAAASGETDLSDNSSTAVTTVGPAPKSDLALTKTGPASVRPGDTLTWTITVVNNGNAPASGVVVTDPLATGLTLVSATGSGFTCTGTSVSCGLAGSLAPAATAVLTVVATLDSAFTGAAVANTAVVGPPDATPADNSDTHVTDVAPLPVAPAPADLVLTKDGPLDAVQPGDTIDWTIEVTNTGGTAATGFTVSDLIPNGLIFTGASGADFDCSGAPALACLYTASLDPGESVTLVVTTTLDITYEADTATNTASVSPLDATDNNTDTAVVDVVFPITGGGGGPAVAPPVGAAPLPATGADVVRGLTLALLLMVLGTLMIVTGRRREVR